MQKKIVFTTPEEQTIDFCANMALTAATVPSLEMALKTVEALKGLGWREDKKWFQINGYANANVCSIFNEKFTHQGEDSLINYTLALSLLSSQRQGMPETDHFMLKALVLSDYDVEALALEQAVTPLHSAIVKKQYDLIDFLTKHGASWSRGVSEKALSQTTLARFGVGLAFEGPLSALELLLSQHWELRDPLWVNTVKRGVDQLKDHPKLLNQAFYYVLTQFPIQSNHYNEDFEALDQICQAFSKAGLQLIHQASDQVGQPVDVEKVMEAMPMTAGRLSALKGLREHQYITPASFLSYWMGLGEAKAYKIVLKHFPDVIDQSKSPTLAYFAKGALEHLEATSHRDGRYLSGGTKGHSWSVGGWDAEFDLQDLKPLLKNQSASLGVVPGEIRTDPISLAYLIGRLVRRMDFEPDYYETIRDIFKLWKEQRPAEIQSEDFLCGLARGIAARSDWGQPANSKTVLWPDAKQCDRYVQAAEEFLDVLPTSNANVHADSLMPAEKIKETFKGLLAVAWSNVCELEDDTLQDTRLSSSYRTPIWGSVYMEKMEHIDHVLSSLEKAEALQVISPENYQWALHQFNQDLTKMSKTMHGHTWATEASKVQMEGLQLRVDSLQRTPPSQVKATPKKSLSL